MKRYAFFLLFFSVLLVGFDFTTHSIPIKEILSGGPPKDGIPALTNPKFVPAKSADFVKKNDRILGLIINGEAKAYPINIMNWHEIVNDVIGGMPVMVSYCPLCGTGMAFDPVIQGKKYLFGVSGLLYKSDVLMYDRETESLWSQIKKEAVTGKMTGTRLKMLPLAHTTWEGWRKKHPETKVLSTETGFRRNYFRDPYATYAQTDQLMFPVGEVDDRYPPKSWVLGVEINGHSKAYSFTELKNAPRRFKDQLGLEGIEIVYEPEFKTTVVLDQKGKEIPSLIAYWFAWSAFHPDTEIFRTKHEKEKPAQSP